MSTENDVPKNMITYFNQTYGSDLLDLEKCKEIHKHYLEKKKSIEADLNLNSTESGVAKTLTRLNDDVNKIETTVGNCREIAEEIHANLDEVDEIRKTVQGYIDKIDNLQCLLQYMKVIQRIENLSTELQREIANKDDEKCATLFANLCEISRNLMESNALHLKQHLKSTLHHWHNILKNKFERDYEEVLKAIKWPFVNTNFSLYTPSQANIQKLQVIAEYLLQIELPDESTSPVITSALLSDFPHLCLPVHFLVLPLRKRFMYHFKGSRQTNRIDKPEWYFTQILSWIRDHVDFVTKWIQPIIDKLGLHHIEARLELMRGLVQLAVEKLYSDLPTLQYDDFTFSHCVDEALGFDKELRETYDYPPTQPSILAVLTQAQIFVKWMNMEKKFATEKMDIMLSSAAFDTFQPTPLDVHDTLNLDDTSGLDDSKITTCADMFVTLLQTITERYESLPQPGHRLQFLDLQLELLDDFRVRLLQLVNAESGDIIDSKIPMIANTLYYIENVLSDWGNMLHYLNLYYYKSQLDVVESKNLPMLDCDGVSGFEMETESVFADTLSLYRHMRKDLLCTLAESVVTEIKSRSWNYRKEKWSSMSCNKDTRTFSLTPAACGMFEILATRLHQLQKNLESKLFTTVWQFIAHQIDTYLFEDLVLDSRFNESGALQFKFDVTRNLFPLFSQFCEKPENFFTHLNESCNLLNISKGSALLLRETLLALEGATGIEDRRGEALKEIGVHNFTPKMAVTILNQRTDITVNRITID